MWNSTGRWRREAQFLSEARFRFSWKWKEPSPTKLMERTHEEATEALPAGREVAILRRRLLDQEPISTVYDELGLQPTVSTAGRKEFFENRGRCFRAEAWPNHSAEEERTAYPEKSDWGTMPELPRSGRDSIHCAKFPLDQCATR